ncbi:MAG: NUDIX domain-containing protein [Lachnospiraceae bacterium]
MGELWNLYDKRTRKVVDGLYYERGSSTPIPESMYHLAIWVYVVTNSGKILLSQRAANKSKAFKWEPSGGSVVMNESAKEAAIRETYEETNLMLNSSDICGPFCEEEGKDFVLQYFYAAVPDAEINIDILKLQESEVMDIKLLDDMKELQAMEERNELVDGVYEGFKKVFEIISK